LSGLPEESYRKVDLATARVGKGGRAEGEVSDGKSATETSSEERKERQ